MKDGVTNVIGGIEHNRTTRASIKLRTSNPIIKSKANLFEDCGSAKD